MTCAFCHVVGLGGAKQLLPRRMGVAGCRDMRRELATGFRGCRFSGSGSWRILRHQRRNVVPQDFTLLDETSRRTVVRVVPDETAFFTFSLSGTLLFNFGSTREELSWLRPSVQLITSDRRLREVCNFATICYTQFGFPNCDSDQIFMRWIGTWSYRG